MAFRKRSYVKKKRTYKKRSTKVSIPAFMRPETKRKIVKVFDSTPITTNYGLVQNLGVSRVLSNLVSGDNDATITGSKIFIKGIQLRYFIRSSATGTDATWGQLRNFFFKAGNGLATRATPVIGDILIAPDASESDLAGMVDKNKITILHDKVSRVNNRGYSSVYYNRYIKINKTFTFADSQADITGSILGKHYDYYAAFMGGSVDEDGNVKEEIQQTLEAVIYYTDA